MTNWMNALSHTKNVIRLRLHVIPHSSKSIFPAGYNPWRNSIEINVQADVKYNKANREVINLIAKYFNISPKNISILSGEKGRNKTVVMKNLKFDEVYRRLIGSINDI
jgi:uncharacterized protein (TIGR00251 family)